jgi:hypothetical protein
MLHRLPAFTLTAALLLFGASSTSAQPTDRLALKTDVEFEVLVPRFGGALEAQSWGPVFQKLGVSVRFRQAILDDKPVVEERTRGTYRTVKVIGEMDTGGTLHVPSKSFKPSDTTTLKEWVDELKTYGAQGSPDGKPLWGLTKEDFDALFVKLSKPLAAEVEGLAPRAALAKLEMPASHPVRLHTSADAKLQGELAARPLRQEVGGFSAGTGLAIVLADYGLAFRPRRTPQATIELVVEPLADISDPWPVGWPLDAKRPLNEEVPQLFDMVTAGFPDLPLQDVLNAVEQNSQTPIVVDYELCATKEIDPFTATVKFPEKKTAWFMLIRSVTAQARLTRELKVDEAGRVFVHVFPFMPKPPPK